MESSNQNEMTPPDAGEETTAESTSTDAGKVVTIGLEDVLKTVASRQLTAQEVTVLKGFAKDYSALKVKVDRLKGLLGRSAKAQREAKMELDGTQKRLDGALADVKRLKAKVDHLSTRPTHMDLLNDFETNFDRALLSVGHHHQSGGQDTAPQMPTVSMMESRESAMDTMLMQELEESRNRVTKLESLNNALMARAAQLEADSKDKKKQRDDAVQKVSHLELELRMSRMEAAHAQRAAEEKAASLEEMQMEIDLVTKASVKANALAAQGQAVAKSSKTDRQHVAQLEAQVQALKEWALASGESKRLAQERVRFLEHKLQLHGADGGLDNSFHDSFGGGSSSGKMVFNKSGSLVVGAGDIGQFVITLEETYPAGTRLILCWKFDSSPTDCTTDFSVKREGKDGGGTFLIKDRCVTGGAAGELEDAFPNGDNQCTLLWSNKKSWVRPRTVKYTLQVIKY